MTQDTPAVAVEHVSFAFDDHVVLSDVSFTVPKGSMTMLLGASGAGKSVLLKLILGLMRPDGGTISVNGERIERMPEQQLLGLRSDVGMVFQENALFDSLTVAENVGFRLQDSARLSNEEVDARVAEVLGFVGLTGYEERMPSALSGGQRRRVGIARAMASKPGLLLFDDPTTGLDPVIASNVDDEIVKLRDLEQVTSIFVTHQIRDAFYVARHEAVKNGGGIDIRDSATERARFLVLHEGRIFFQGTGAELLAAHDDYLKEFLFMTLPPW
ncbi:MAG TPA: ATP-binding cassette domain-containing protein [Vicinamibacterales bacterium]|nr:ATP-binding cassette domain-containing protein [Vicinamibacterales bacterium]